MREIIDRLEEGLSQEEYFSLLANLNCSVIETELPLKVKGLTLKDDNGYMVYVNTLLTPVNMRKALKHEFLHIMDEDFSKEGNLLVREMKVAI